MDKLSYRCHRFPSVVIQQAIWLYFRFALSYRDVEDMLAERGIDVSYETVRRWALKFGGIIARQLRQRRSSQLRLERSFFPGVKLTNGNRSGVRLIKNEQRKGAVT